VFSTGNLKYRASKSIVLNPGFVVGYNGNFLAEILSACGASIAAVDGGGSNGVEDLLVDEIITSEGEALEGLEVANSNFYIYPNPNNGQFTLELNNNEEKASVVVYDLMGKIVYSKNGGDNIEKIDISAQPEGIYFVKVSIGEQVFNEKVIYQ
jgi:hypothetical protein